MDILLPDMKKSIWEYENHKDGDCIVFDGPKSGGGYGYACINNQVVRAHRAVWEEEIGKIPEGMTVDHVCYQKDCINIEHLRLLTHSENTKLSRTNIARRAKTHCPHGHQYDETNTYTDKRGSRHCKTCLTNRDKEFQEKRKEQRHLAMAIRKLKCRNKLHNMTPENTRILANGSRQCIACSRATKIRWNHNNK